MFFSRIRIREDSRRGTSILKMGSVDGGRDKLGNVEFMITAGNEDGVFQILR